MYISYIYKSVFSNFIFETLWNSQYIFKLKYNNENNFVSIHANNNI